MVSLTEEQKKQMMQAAQHAYMCVARAFGIEIKEIQCVDGMFLLFIDKAGKAAISLWGTVTGFDILESCYALQAELKTKVELGISG